MMSECSALTCHQKLIMKAKSDNLSVDLVEHPTG